MQPNDSQAPLARLLPSAAVRAMCGGISGVALWRWMNRPELGFPRPIAIGQRNYWREADILAWLKSREVAA